MQEDLKTAVRLLEALTQDKPCAFAHRFHTSRPLGETCAEFKTWEQGHPSPPCFICEAKEFVARMKALLQTLGHP
jgi:hypothetical protein